MAYYVDSSALVKLIVSEPETTRLRRWLGEVGDEVLSSDLARAEVLRAVRRVAPDRVTRARQALDSVDLIQLTTATYEEAGRLEPRTLRTLDALHLASALSLGDDLEGIVCYDERLAEAAEIHGIFVIAPRGRRRA